MAGYPLNLEPHPTVNPIGAPGNDYEHIEARPDMFGGAIARSLGNLGESVEKVSNTGFQVAEQKKEMDDKTHAAELHSWGSDEWSKNSGSYLTLEGRAAVSGLAGYKQKNQEILDNMVSQAGDPYTKQLIQQQSRRVMDSHNDMAARYAAGQEKVYQHKTAQLNEASSGNQAVLFATNGEQGLARQFLFHAGQEVRNQAEIQGYTNKEQIDQLVAQKRGGYVAQIVEGLARKEGVGYGPKAAIDFYDSERKNIDAASATKIEAFLHGDITKIAAEKRGEDIWTRAGAGLSSRIVGVRDDATAKLAEKGIPLNVTSGYRSPEHNAAVGGARGSQHLRGRAMDVSLNGLTPEQQQTVINQFLTDPRVGGFGYYPHSNSIHVDVRQGDRAAWGTNYHSDSVGQGWPAWMTQRVQQWQAGGGQQVQPVAAAQPSGAAPLAANLRAAPEAESPAVAAGLPVAPRSGMPSAVAPMWQEQKAISEAEILNDPELRDRPQLKAALLQNIRERATAAHDASVVSHVAEKQDAAAIKEQRDLSADQYTQQIWAGQHTPSFDWVAFAGKVAGDPKLGGDNGQTRERLLERIAKRSGEEQSLEYGGHYLDVKHAILSEPGSPGHIATMADVYRLPEGSLTEKGEAEISRIMTSIKKSPDEAALQKAKAGIEQYAKLTMSREQDLGPVKIADPKGEKKFNGEFLPQFNAAFSKWVSDGKNPWEFVTRENVDKLIERIYPKNERSMDAVADKNGPAGPPEAPNAPLPPTPEGIQPEHWAKVMVRPPMLDNGQPMNHARWANILNKLITDPSEEVRTALDRHLEGTGLTAMELLETLTPPDKDEAKPAEPAPAAAAPEPAPPVEMPRLIDTVSEEFKREQEDPNNPAVRLRKWFEKGLHPEAVQEKRHPEGAK